MKHVRFNKRPNGSTQFIAAEMEKNTAAVKRGLL